MVALRKISPPFKPPTAADDDDVCDRGRSGDWMFCTPSRRGSFECDFDAADGLFRDFTFTAGGRKDVEEEVKAARKDGRRSSWSAAP